jgi:ankyrin repeat protein
MSLNINESNNNQITSILIASTLGNKDIVKSLLAQGANIHETDIHGSTNFYLLVI